MANTIPGVAAATAALFGGWLASVSGCPVMFGLSAVIGLAGYALLRRSVRVPRFSTASPARLAAASEPHA